MYSSTQAFDEFEAVLEVIDGDNYIFPTSYEIHRVVMRLVHAVQAETYKNAGLIHFSATST